MGVYEEICSKLTMPEEEFNHIKSDWAEETANKLNHYVDNIMMINELIEYVAGIGYLPSNLNFRDALFHYKVAYEADHIVTLIEQNNSIQEHLHRAIKDGITVIIRAIINILSDFYKGHLGDSGRRKELLMLQHWIHEYKNKEMEMRLNSLEIQRSFESEQYLLKLIELNNEARKSLSDEWFKPVFKKVFDME